MISPRSLVVLLVACAMSAFGSPSVAQESWTTYRNARFGTQIAYQEYFAPDPPPANRDGQSFSGPKRTSFRVFARRNQGGETPASILADLTAGGDHPNPSYKTIRGRRLALSGRRADQIYYEAYIVSDTGIIHCFSIEYPAKFRSDHDPVVATMARSFTGP